MHQYLKQSTASQSRMIGPFVDDTDFKSVETGLTIANTDIKINKNGAASVDKNSGGGTHRSNGMYSITLDATDTDTVGELTLSIVVSGALIVVAKFTVLEETVYDALFGASAPGYLQPTTAGRTLDVAATGEAGVDLGNVTGTLTQANVGWVDVNSRVDIGNWLGTAVTTSSTTSKPEVDIFSVSDKTATATTTVDFDDLASILTDTSEIGTAGAGLTDLGGMSSGMTTEVENAVWDAAASSHNSAGSFGKFLRQIKEGTIAVESTVNDASATDTSFITALTEASDSHYSDSVMTFIDGALQGQSRVIATYTGATKTVTFNEAWSEAPGNGDAFIILTMHAHTVAQIADGIWDEATAGHTTAGTYGKAVSDILVDTNSLNDTKIPDTISLANINGEVVDVVNVDTLVANQTIAEALRRIGAITSGKISGAQSGTETFLDYAESANSIVVTVGATGNRTAITYN